MSAASKIKTIMMLLRSSLSLCFFFNSAKERSAFRLVEGRGTCCIRKGGWTGRRAWWAGGLAGDGLVAGVGRDRHAHLCAGREVPLYLTPVRTAPNPMRPHFPGRFVEGPLAKAPIPSPTHPNRLTPPHAGYHAPAVILWEAAQEEPGR